MYANNERRYVVEVYTACCYFCTQLNVISFFYGIVLLHDFLISTCFFCNLLIRNTRVSDSIIVLILTDFIADSHYLDKRQQYPHVAIPITFIFSVHSVHL